MKLYVISFLLLLFTVLAPSKVLSQNDNELEMARQYIAITKRYSALDTIKFYTNLAYEIANRKKDIPLLIDCFNNLAYIYGQEKNYDSAIVYYKKHYIMVSESNSRTYDMARTLGNLGICYKNTQKYIDMWRCFYQSKNLFEQLHDTSKICWATIEMGEAYEHFGMYQQAHDYYNSALSLAQANNAANDIAICHFNIGNAIINENFGTETDSTAIIMTRARDFLTRAVNECYYQTDNLTDTLRHRSMLALSKCYMALLHTTSKHPEYADSCRIYLARYTAKQNTDSLATETLKAMLLMNDKAYKEAIEVLENATHLNVKNTYSRDMANVYKLLYEAYAAIKKTKEAYLAKKKYIEIYDKSSDEENIKRAANFAAQTEINAARDQHENERKIREAHDHADKIKQESIFKSLMEGLVATALIALAIIASIRQKNRLNKELNDRNDKLLAQRDVIERQKNDEQQAQAIILSSVEYASQIQSRAIGNEESVTAIFPENFIYYHPRNIVSGDWYMATSLKGHRIMIEADCTGHGIPGALLCMLGVSAMKDIINKLRHSSSPILPGLILDEMRTAIKKALNKDTADSKTNIDDGMDMSIVILPPSNDKLLFSGANQSVILISGGEAIRLKGDANPIGNYVREKEHFETTEQSVNSGDAVYLFSDGIQDQTGGDNERKYSFKRLMDFLYEHHTLPMKQQMALFEQDIDSYTGESPQVDDRTLVGIRI